MNRGGTSSTDRAAVYVFGLFASGLEEELRPAAGAAPARHVVLARVLPGGATPGVLKTSRSLGGELWRCGRRSPRAGGFGGRVCVGISLARECPPFQLRVDHELPCFIQRRWGALRRKQQHEHTRPPNPPARAHVLPCATIFATSNLPSLPIFRPFQHPGATPGLQRAPARDDSLNPSTLDPRLSTLDPRP